MIKLTLFIACLIMATALPSKLDTIRKPMPDGRIVGGEDAEIEDYPYQVSLLYNGSHICGGTIISDTYVITASHCTYGAHDFELSIRTGSSILNIGGKVINVAKVHRNPKYDISTLDSDISILELDDKIIFGNQSQAIGIIDAGTEVPPKTDAVVTGWGLKNSGDLDLPTKLQVVTLPIVSNTICNEIYKDIRGITDRMLCAGFAEGGKGFCQGDSGGPLVTDGVLIGIVSWGWGCGAPGYPSVFANVTALRDYITEVTGL